MLELQRDENNAPLSRAAIEEQLTSLLQELRVDHLRASPALALSGGERRRVEIARALPRSRVSFCWTSPLLASTPSP